MLILTALCLYSKTDLLVRQRFQNPLPAPSFPPKLLTIRTDPSRYASYDFLVPLSMERVTPMIVDAEGGMPLDQNLVPGYWESSNQGRGGRMAPDLSTDAPELDDEDIALLADPSGVNQAGAGVMPSGSGANMGLIGSGAAGANAVGSAAAALDRRRKQVAFVRRAGYDLAKDSNKAAAKKGEELTQCVHCFPRCLRYIRRIARAPD